MATRLMIFVLALTLGCAVASAGTAVQPLDGFAAIHELKLADLSWVKRQARTLPAFKSEQVRFTWWTLGNNRAAPMLMAWDESAGTGKGYDTLYIDSNLNGDLTEAGECIPSTGKQDGMPVFDAQATLADGK